MSIPLLTRRHALLLGSAMAASVTLSGGTRLRSRATILEDYAALLPGELDFSGTVLLARHGEIEFEGAYGLADRRSARPNTIATRFNLASLSKMFTAICILQLVEAGRVSLQDPIGMYLPDYPNIAARTGVLVEHLLMHTSGIGNYWEGLDALDGEWPDTHRDYLPLFADIPLEHEPGTAFSYSNGGYILLGLIVEAVTGTNFYDHVQSAVLDRAGMRDTGYERVEEPDPDRATGYMRSLEHPGEWEDCTARWERRGSAAGGAFSTAPDLNRFATALTEHRLLSPEMTEVFLQGRRETPVGNYGYGVVEQSLNGHRVIGHSGGHYGVAVELMIFPDQGTTFVVLTNGDVDGYWDVEMFVHELIAGPTDETRNYAFTRELITETISTGYDGGVARYRAAGTERTPRTGVVELAAFKHIHRGQDEAGLDLLRLNRAIRPESEDTMFSLAQGLRVTGRTSEALAMYQAYVERVPDSEEAQTYIDQLREAVRDGN